MNWNHMVTLFIALVLSVSCQQSERNESKNTRTDAHIASAPDNTKMGTFTEGMIDVAIYFPGNNLDELLKKVDPSKGNIEQQLEKLAESLPKEEQERIKATTENDPFTAMQVMFTPLINNQIWLTENTITAKCDGLTYHLENTLDVRSQTGKVFVQSRGNATNRYPPYELHV